MSYIRAKQVVADTAGLVDEITHEVTGSPDLDMNLDDEILDFVLALIAKVNDLREGEALVVWKDIF